MTYTPCCSKIDKHQARSVSHRDSDSRGLSFEYRDYHWHSVTVTGQWRHDTVCAVRSLSPGSGWRRTCPSPSGCDGSESHQKPEMYAYKRTGARGRK
eukprot:529534-Rhodomonas_salina.1